jgi:MFS family permease
LLGQIDLSLPYLVRAGLVLIAFAIGFRSMHDLGFTPRTMRFKGIVSEMRKVGRAGLRFGWRQPSVRLLMLTSFVFFGFFSWAWYAWQPYFLELLGRNLVWVSGVIAALFSLASIGGNALVHRIARPGRRRTTILLAASAIMTLCFVATGAIHIFWIAVPVFLLAALVSGLLSPIRQSYLHGLIPSEQRATIVSFDSLIGSVGSVGGQTGLGWLSQERSIASGFVLGGLATAVALPIFAKLRARNDDVDVLRSPEEAEPEPILR